jgi:hypothetical protein
VCRVTLFVTEDRERVIRVERPEEDWLRVRCDFVVRVPRALLVELYELLSILNRAALAESKTGSSGGSNKQAACEEGGLKSAGCIYPIFIPTTVGGRGSGGL